MSSSKETGAANNNGEETGDGRGAPESSGSDPAPPVAANPVDFDLAGALGALTTLNTPLQGSEHAHAIQPAQAKGAEKDAGEKGKDGKEEEEEGGDGELEDEEEDGEETGEKKRRGIAAQRPRRRRVLSAGVRVRMETRGRRALRQGTVARAR